MGGEPNGDQAEEAIRRLLSGLHTRLGLDATVVSRLSAVPFRLDESLDAGQVATARLLATTLAEYFEQDDADRRRVERRRHQLDEVAADRDFTIVLQPIVGLATGETAGMEALARFPTLGQGPGEVFAEAWLLGVGGELELAAVDAAIDLLDRLADDIYLSVNVAPATLADPRFLERAQSLPPGRLVAEVTEHAVIADYAKLTRAAQRLAAAGVRFAIDDVGAGLSGLERILRVNPDVLKIDKSLVRDIDTSRVRHAMVSALTVFAAEVGVSLVAEGIETDAELAALCALGVGYGQGFYLARPHPPSPRSGTRPG